MLKIRKKSIASFKKPDSREKKENAGLQKTQCYARLLFVGICRARAFSIFLSASFLFLPKINS